MFMLVFVPVAAAVIAAALGMLASGLFPRWLPWLGIVSGSVGLLGGLIQLAALRGESALVNLGNPMTGVGVLGFWIWMLATGILLWRRTPERSPAAEAAA